MLALPWRDVDVSKIVIGGQRVRLIEGESGAGDTTGSIVWDAAMVLARYLEREPQNLGHVLEVRKGREIYVFSSFFSSWAPAQESLRSAALSSELLESLLQTCHT
jgi:hypothetical protein